MDNQIEQVITELSKIDAAAENILVQAETEKQQYAAEMQEKTRIFDENLEKDMKKRLSQYEEKLRKENQSHLDKLQKQTVNQIKNLETAYEKQHKIWAEDILQSILHSQEDI